MPIWIMRQAGRYLPEYRELRAKHSMLEMVRTPELATEVTLQPLRRFPLDAGIIFADILTPLIGMGIDLEFRAGEGPVITNPVRSLSDIEVLRVPAPEENVKYTLDAIRMVSREIAATGTPLLGFSGAPFTLSSYLIEGQSPGDLARVKTMMFKEPAAWHALQTKLVDLVADYLVAQAEAGAAAVQIFDSWLGVLGPSQYIEYVEPYLHLILENVRSRTIVPVIFFATGTAGLHRELARLDVDAFGIDWRSSLGDVRSALGRNVVLQGNLDPMTLFAPFEVIEREANRILTEGKELKGHIFNLGHGVLQHTPVENVERLVQHVRSWKG